MNTQKRRAPKKMSEKRLRNIAVWYCERYLVSSGKLTDHLNKRLYRDVRDEEERAEFSAMIPGIVSSLAELGYVNDREAASARLRTTASLVMPTLPSAALGLISAGRRSGSASAGMSAGR